MLPQPPIPTPVLCRLCRRPIARAAVKCPYCGARLRWSHRARDVAPLRIRSWRVVGYAGALALLLVAAIVWLSVLREVNAPVSSVEGTANPPGRPSPVECAELISDLAKPSTTNQPVTPELRDRLRQCLTRR